MANVSVAHEQLLEEHLAVTRQAVLPGELRSDVKSGRRRSPRSCALCHATVPPPLQMCDGDAPLVRSHCLPPANVSGDQARSCAHGWGTWHRLTHTVAVLVPDLLRRCGLAAARGKKVSASHSVARPAPARRDAVNMPVVIDGTCSSSSSTTPTRSCSSRHARIVPPQRRAQSLRAFQPKVSTWFIPSLPDHSSYTIVSGCVRLYQPPTVAETTPLAEVSWRGGHTTALC
jgi:hypothetical protein